MPKKKFHKTKDPHLKRESSQYSHPVPSREFITKYLDESSKPLTYEQLVDAFELTEEEEREGLKRRLIAMQRDGQLIMNRRGSYALVSKMDGVKGRVQANRDGSGYVVSEKEGQDLYLPAREMYQVFNGDIVLAVAVETQWRKREGRIVEIIERNTQQVVGRFGKEKNMGYVDPDNKSIKQDVIIPAENENNAKVGQFVVVEIIEQPTKRRQAIGRVVEILGDQLTAGMEFELAVRSYDLPFKWPQKTLDEAQSFPAEVPKEAVEDREDFRHLPFVTIDGEDAKDFDDAVYCEHTKNSGYQLYVAIADVSHYVKPDSPLDNEAVVRGNSVYFPANVLPMLPETLSNNLCSLRPKCDRLVLVCIMDVSAEGKIEKSRFANGVIHSQARLTYTEVAEMLKGEKTENDRMYKHLKPLYQLFKLFLKQRSLRGAIEFESIETKIIFDDKGKIEKIVPRKRNEAHKIIEEAMLAANVCTAMHLEKSKLPVLYRVHPTPKPERLELFRDFLKPFGLRLPGATKPSTMDYATLLNQISKREDAALLQTVMLRSMQQAVYSPDNEGHFGLSYEGYTHFTSPIRRYPDLLVHRAIKHTLLKNKKEPFLYNHADMAKFGEHCSMTERRADKATRDATDWLKCEFMLDNVGKKYKGRIVEVTNFGVFVQLEEVYVQGLVHITALSNDYYQYDATHHTLRGKKGGVSYRLGDPINIIVAKVDLDERRIDFDLDEPGAPSLADREAASKKSRSSSRGEKPDSGKKKKSFDKKKKSRGKKKPSSGNK